jgi:translocation and assembly module TamB
LKTLSWILAVLLLLFAIVLALPFSATGTRLLIDGINRSQIVQLDYASGSLFGDLALSGLAMELGTVTLQLDEVHTRLQLQCFWRSAFCLDELRVGALRLDVAAGDAEPGSEAGDPELLQIPFAYEINALVIDSAQLSWPGGGWTQGELRGQISLKAGHLEITTATIGNARLQVSSAEASEKAYAGFEPPEIFLPLPLTVHSLSLQEAHIQIGGVERSLDSVSLVADWNGYDLTVGTLELIAQDYGNAALQGSVRFAEDWPSDLSLELAFLESMEPAVLGGRQLSIETAGDLSALNVELFSPGEPALAASLEADVTSAALSHQVSATLAWPQGTRVGQILEQDSQLSELEITGPVQLQMQGSLEQQALTASASATGLGYEALTVDADLALQAPEIIINSLRVEDAASDSQLMVTGSVDLAERSTLLVQVASTGFALPSSVPGRLSGELELGLDVDVDSWALRWREMDLAGTVNGLPASARGSAGLDSALRLLPGTTEANINGAQIYASAGEDASGGAQLSVQLDDLGRWVGGARGSLSLAGQGSMGRQKIALEGQARDIYVSGVAADVASLSIAYDGEDDSLEGLVSLPQVDSSDYTLRDLTLTLDGSLDKHRLALSSQGAVAGNLQLDGTWANERWRGVLRPTQLDTTSGPWRLSDPVAMAWTAEEPLTIADHCWRHQEFSLCGEALALGGKGTAQLDLTGDVRAFNGLLPRGLRLRGAVAATLDAAWAPDQALNLNATVQADQLQAVRRYGMGERVSVTWDLIDLTVLHRSEGLEARGRVVREGRQVMFLDALLPVASEGPLRGSLQLRQLQLSTLSPWLTQFSDIEGALSGDLSLAGTPSEPRARGELQLVGAEVALVGNPTKLTELALRLTLDGERASYSGSGLLGGGQVNLSGQVLTRPGLRVELSVTGQEHEILLPPASSVRVSEDLALVLTDGLLDVRGEVRVHEGVLRHEELPAGSVALSPEIVVVDTLGNVIKEERPFDIRADVQVRIRNRFQVEGEGLRATLGGDLHVVQTPGETAQVFGNLNVVNGELEAYRQRLQIRRGLIDFSGPADNPGLDIVAEREIREDNVTVGARLFGTLEEPVLEVFSDPVMPQGEAMSYLVRGRGLDSGAGGDGTALALSMGASVVNQSGIVAELNRLPLISDVSFGASGAEDDTAATVSGYVGSRLYLSYGRGLYEPINELTARLYLQSRLWLEVVSRLENSADLYYSFDIN